MADEPITQTVARNITPEVDTSKTALGPGHFFDPGSSPQAAGEQQYKEALGSPQEVAFGKIKNWLADHEQHFSDKVLKPFRQGLDNMADEIDASPVVKAASPVAQGVAKGTAELMRQVPVGKDVKSTAAAMISPPELSEEKKVLDFSKIEGHKLIEEAPEYTEKTFYHGTKAPIKSISEADSLGHGDAGALAGIGTYLTDKPEVASGYAMGKKAAVPEGGRVLAGKLRKDAKILDLDKPVPPEVRETFAKQIRGIFGDTNISDSQLDNDYFRSPGDKATKQINGNDLFDGLRRAMIEEGYPTSAATEVMQNIATEVKHTHGYDVLQYEGGKRIPRYGSHKAIVVLPDMKTGRMPEGILKDTVPAKETPPQPEPEHEYEIRTRTQGRPLPKKDLDKATKGL